MNLCRYLHLRISKFFICRKQPALTAKLIQNGSSSVIPGIIALSITFIIGAYYWDLLHIGTIRDWDEYYTLDRSNAFLTKNDWMAVYEGNLPYFTKPPLQYWLTAIAMTQSPDLEFSLRLPTYIFGLLLLIITGVLSYIINPNNPYAMPSALLLLSASEAFWDYSLSAMLDIGAAFFSTLAITGTILALRQPLFWYLVAVAVSCGALQKAPIAAVFVAGILILVSFTQRWYGIRISSILQNLHFRVAFTCTVFVILLWPGIQYIRYGFISIEQAYIEQIWERLSPVWVPIKPSDHLWYQWILQDESILWIPALVSVFIIPVVFRSIEALIPAFIVSCFLIAMAMASGPTYPRYTFLILPLLAASLAALISGFTKYKPAVLLIVSVFVLILGTPFFEASELRLLYSTQTKHLPLLRDVRASLRDGETFIRCRWWPSETIPHVMYPGAISYFGSDGRPVFPLRKPRRLPRHEHIEKVVTPPYRGVCATAQFDALRKWLVDYVIIQQANGYVHWTSSGSVSAEQMDRKRR